MTPTRYACMILTSLLASADGSRAQDTPEPLGSNEGYLLVALDTANSRFRSISLDGGLTLGDVYTIKRDEIGPGVNYRLIKLKAGEYHWARLLIESSANVRQFRQVFYDLDDDRFAMQVIASRISYGGHLYADFDYSTGDFKFLNRVTMAIDHLRECCNEQLERYGFAYTGPGEDPFPDFYLGLPDQADAE